MDISTFNSPGDVYTLHNNLLSNVATPRRQTFAPRQEFFEQVKPSITCTNQKSSGRCWIFAALNMLRRPFIKEMSLSGDFQFSQSHLFFYDKLERMNYNIGLLQKWIGEGKTKSSREVQHLLKEPFGDGGQWAMFANLVRKYGVVPQYAYPESFHTSNSRGVNMVLTRMFRNFARVMFQQEGAVDKKPILQETYTVLVKFMGEPPREFVWEHRAKDGTITKQTTTPQAFAKDIAKINMDDYVSLTHDPRNDLMKLYGVDGLGNVEGGEEVKYLNVTIERMRDLVKECVDKNQSVWFGSDVGQFAKTRDGILDMKHFDYLGYLELQEHMTKRDRIELCESLMTHAMTFDGYHSDPYGNVDYWLIENSWGSDGPYKGHLVCSDAWFREYTYQLVVPRSFLDNNESVVWNSNVFETRFPLWDPMGSLAM